MLKSDTLNTIKDFDAIRITIASPEEIRSWSFGEVKNRRQSITGHLNQKKIPN